MTNITDLAREAGFTVQRNEYVFGEMLEKFAALHRASIIESLTGGMPEPLRAVCVMVSAVGSTHMTPKDNYYTATQLREYAAGLAAKAVAAVALRAGQDALDTANSICRAVAELPDRNSPEDWPEAMLVTHDELKDIILEAMKGQPT